MMQSESVDYKGRILVVDDEIAVGTVLQQWLLSEGYEVDYANRFAEVERAFAQGTYDLVTLDIMMPEIDGLQTLQWLQAHHADVGVLMATALSNTATVLQAMRGGAIDYLLKPFNMELVSEEVARAMERQRLVAENRAYQEHLEKLVAERTQELQEAYARLQTHMRELEGRDRLVQLQMSPPERVEEAHREALRVIEDVFQAERVGLYCADSTAKALRLVAALGWSGAGMVEGEQELVGFPAIEMDAGENPIARAFAEGRALHMGGIAVPVIFNEETLGALWIETGRADGVGDEQLNAAWRLGREVALVLRMVQMAGDLELGRVEIDELLRLE